MNKSTNEPEHAIQLATSAINGLTSLEAVKRLQQLQVNVERCILETGLGQDWVKIYKRG